VICSHSEGRPTHRCLKNFVHGIPQFTLWLLKGYEEIIKSDTAGESLRMCR
jgi:hypothetical protein